MGTSRERKLELSHDFQSGLLVHLVCASHPTAATEMKQVFNGTVLVDALCSTKPLNEV